MLADDADGRSVLPRSRKTRAILAILALAAPRPVLRSQLTGLLWSRRGKEQAFASLRQAVHELQGALGAHGTRVLRVDRNHLSLHDTCIWVDVRVSAASVAPGSDSLRPFRAPLLEDLYGLDPAFDQWLLEERERTEQRLRSLEEATLATSDDIHIRIASAERLLRIDPMHEEAWRALIAGHLESGDDEAVRSAYSRYVAAFSRAGLLPAIELHAVSSIERYRVTNRSKAGLLAKGVKLAVMPTRNLSGAHRENPIPGLVDEVMAAVSRFRWISCIGDTDRERQDIDFFLDSAFQRSTTQIRLIIRLLDPHDSGAVFWASSFDRKAGDELSLQEQLAAEIAAQIDPELLLRYGERILATDLPEPTAFDLTMRAIPAIYRLEPIGFHAAGKSLAAATSLDPGNAAAHAWWAYWHLFLVGQAWAKDSKAATVRAGELAERAVTLDPGDARAITLVGHVRGFLHKRVEEALSLHGKALSLNPSLPLAWCFSGLANSYLGRHADAIEQIGRAQCLSPHDPHAFFFDMALMMPYYLRRDFAMAATLGRRAVELNPGFSSTYKGYLATLGQLGQEQEAARVRARLLALEPAFSVSNALQRSPMVQADDRALYADGLRRGGLREN
jgi:DNA-binding SARP family transcriptional activator/TolB-like protein